MSIIQSIKEKSSSVIKEAMEDVAIKQVNTSNKDDAIKKIAQIFTERYFRRYAENENLIAKANEMVFTGEGYRDVGMKDLARGYKREVKEIQEKYLNFRRNGLNDVENELIEVSKDKGLDFDKAILSFKSFIEEGNRKRLGVDNLNPLPIKSLDDSRIDSKKIKVKL